MLEKPMTRAEFLVVASTYIILTSDVLAAYIQGLLGL